MTPPPETAGFKVTEKNGCLRDALFWWLTRDHVVVQPHHAPSEGPKGVPQVLHGGTMPFDSRYMFVESDINPRS